MRTALLLGALTTLLLGLLLAAVGREFSPLLQPALRLWLRGNLLQPAGFVLFALRGRIDDLFTVVLANLLLAVAFSDYLRALHLLMQRPDPRRIALVAVLIAIVPIAFFTLVVDLIAPRIVIASAVLGTLCAASTHVLLRGGGAAHSIAQRVTALLFALAAAVLWLRLVYTVLRPEAVRDGLQGGTMQALTFGTGAVLPLLCSYGFLLLCNARMRQELERSAAIDFLTGALNRGAIEDQGARLFARARRHARPCAAIVIDVDHFKTINDVYGHAAGDLALREVAQRLREQLRLEDALGRLGGEEFLAVLDETGADAALRTAERLRHAVASAALTLENGQHAATISLGVAVLDDSDVRFADLVRRADRALYRAKEAGRDRVMLAAR